MRKFCSYGPVDTRLHYYVERRELVEYALSQLRGERPEEGGHYITVWAPRQRGKTWVMQQVLWRLQEDERFDAVKVNVQVLKGEESIAAILDYIVAGIARQLGRELPRPESLLDFERVFSREVLERPLVLMLDEFDALNEEAISDLAGAFRNIYIRRRDQVGVPTEEKEYLLHGVGLIGVRAVLGVESSSGSPFNVQRSLHIPNLTFEEVDYMYHWYERESGQVVEQEVIDRVYYETQGQPGLVSWLGELLTEQYNDDPTAPLTMKQFNRMLLWAINGLGNANVLNIISKARQDGYKEVVLEMFETGVKKEFRFDDPQLNFLYLNGVIDIEEGAERLYARFPCPFIQKRLFNYFAGELFDRPAQLYDPFADLSAVITEEGLNVAGLLRLYEEYLGRHRERLLADVPRRRTDFRPYEAVYHFNLYVYLDKFLEQYGGRVWPEFPTGNGKVDLLIKYAGRRYAVEVKSFASVYEYRRALRQAARYGAELGLEEITLALFVEAVDEENRARYEVEYVDEGNGVRVRPVFVETG